LGNYVSNDPITSGKDIALLLVHHPATLKMQSLDLSIDTGLVSSKWHLRKPIISPLNETQFSHYLNTAIMGSMERGL